MQSKQTGIALYLWGEKARLRYLFIAAAFILFTFLGSHDLWTQEHRWADIVSGMFYRQDYLHPYLGLNRYYDKPLLSYWLIVAIVKVTGVLNTWALRIPSAAAGLLAVAAIYQLGKELKNKQFGFLASYMLLSTFYFVFWARVSSADMLNMAGSLCAIAWYWRYRSIPSLRAYTLFFIIMALTSLCKGLVGAVIPGIVILLDIVLQKTWRQYFSLTLCVAMLPAICIYLAPFIASNYFGGESYHQDGLYLVYRENILRYFHPFDHQGPIYTYFIYLPIYLLPWTIAFIPALFSLRARWQQMQYKQKWLVYSLLATFLFFTLSGSRRSYYVLPILPFAILLTADYIQDKLFAARQNSIGKFCVFFLCFMFLVQALLIPAYYAQYGMQRFAQKLMQTASIMRPWYRWKIMMLDAETKLNFYLQLPPTLDNIGVDGDRDAQTIASLQVMWPMLLNLPKNTIFVTRENYAPMIDRYFIGYQKVTLPKNKFFTIKPENAPLAYIPPGP